MMVPRLSLRRPDAVTGRRRTRSGWRPVKGAHLQSGIPTRERIIAGLEDRGFRTDQGVRTAVVEVIAPRDVLETRTIQRRVLEILGRSCRPTAWRVNRDTRKFEVVYIQESPIASATLERWGTLHSLLRLYGWGVKMMLVESGDGDNLFLHDLPVTRAEATH